MTVLLVVIESRQQMRARFRQQSRDKPTYILQGKLHTQLKGICKVCTVVHFLSKRALEKKNLRGNDKFEERFYFENLHASSIH